MEFEALQDILVKILGLAPDEIRPDSRFNEDLLADSLDMYQVMLEMEDVFGITAEPDKIKKIELVSEAVDYIKEAEKRQIKPD